MFKKIIHFILGCFTGSLIFATLFYYLNTPEIFSLDAVILLFFGFCCIVFGLLEIIVIRLLKYRFHYNQFIQGLVLVSLYIVFVTIFDKLNPYKSVKLNGSLYFLIFPLGAFLVWTGIDFLFLTKK